MEMIQRNTPNQSKGRKGQVPKLIVCHRTAGSYNGAVSWLCNKQSGASSHFVVSKKGEVTQLVDIENTAWCNGTSTNSNNSKYYKNSTLDLVRNTSVNANSYSVTIEFEGLSNENGELTEVQFKKGVELIKYIVIEVERLYGYEIKVDAKTLVGHCHITPKWKPNCPGLSFPFDKLISEVVGEYMVEKRDVIFNGEETKVNGIFHEGKNYVELRELTKLGLSVGYDGVKKVPKLNIACVKVGKKYNE